MPSSSRKKNRGRARKASRNASLIQAQGGSCSHGMQDDLPQSAVQFIETFNSEMVRLVGGGAGEDQHLTPLKAVMLSMDATRTRHEGVWQESRFRDAVKSCFVKLGTDQVLKQEQRHYDFAAALAVGVMRLDDQENASTWSVLDCAKGRGKIRDLVLSSPREATRFFSKRTPCSCLDELLTKVKSQAKVGQCIHCDNEKECNAMFLCGNCRIHQYCSKECQRQAWKDHKPICEQLCERFSRPRGSGWVR